MRYTGVTSRGIITPIFRQGDDLVRLVCDSIMQASAQEGFTLHDRDVVGVTEAVVARTQGNYATIEQIAEDVRQKLGGRDMGIIFPIMSRNRFAIILRALSMACSKLYVQFSYPADGRMQGLRIGFNVYGDCAGILRRNPSMKPSTGFSVVDQAWVARFFR